MPEEFDILGRLQEEGHLSPGTQYERYEKPTYEDPRKYTTGGNVPYTGIDGRLRSRRPKSFAEQYRFDTMERPMYDLPSSDEAVIEYTKDMGYGRDGFEIQQEKAFLMNDALRMVREQPDAFPQYQGPFAQYDFVDDIVQGNIAAIPGLSPKQFATLKTAATIHVLQEQSLGRRAKDFASDTHGIMGIRTQDIDTSRKQAQEWLDKNVDENLSMISKSQALAATGYMPHGLDHDRVSQFRKMHGQMSRRDMAARLVMMEVMATASEDDEGEINVRNIEGISREAFAAVNKYLLHRRLKGQEVDETFDDHRTAFYAEAAKGLSEDELRLVDEAAVAITQHRAGRERAAERALLNRTAGTWHELPFISQEVGQYLNLGILAAARGMTGGLASPEMLEMAGVETPTSAEDWQKAHASRGTPGKVGLAGIELGAMLLPTGPSGASLRGLQAATGAGAKKAFFRTVLRKGGTTEAAERLWQASLAAQTQRANNIAMTIWGTGTGALQGGAVSGFDPAAMAEGAGLGLAGTGLGTFGADWIAGALKGNGMFLTGKRILAETATEAAMNVGLLAMHGGVEEADVWAGLGMAILFGRQIGKQESALAKIKAAREGKVSTGVQKQVRAEETLRSLAADAAAADVTAIPAEAAGLPGVRAFRAKAVEFLRDADDPEKQADAVTALVVTRAKSLKMDPDEFISSRFRDIVSDGEMPSSGDPDVLWQKPQAIPADADPEIRRATIERPPPQELVDAGFGDANPIEWVKAGTDDDVPDIGIPGGVAGLDDTSSTFTFWDMWRLRSQGINPARLDPKIYKKISDKMARSHQRALEQDGWGGLNRLVFSITSSGTRLYANEVTTINNRFRTPEQVAEVADIWAQAERDVADPNIVEAKDVQSRAGWLLKEKVGQVPDAQGNDPLSFTRNQRDTRNMGGVVALAVLAREKGIDFFRMQPGETPEQYVGRMADEALGLHIKTSNFAQMMGDPVNWPFPTIDSHMNQLLGYGAASPAGGKLKGKTVIEGKPYGKRAKELQGLQHLDAEVIAGIKARLQKKIATAKDADALKKAQGRLDTINTIIKHLKALGKRQAKSMSPGQFQWWAWDLTRGKLEPHAAVYPGLHRIDGMTPDRLRSAVDHLRPAGYTSSEPAIFGAVKPDEAVYFQEDTAGTGAYGSVEFGDDGRAIVRGFSGRDVSTLVHEVGHVFLADMEVSQPDAYRRITQALGSETGALTRQQHEHFARAFERYLRTGKSPTPELNSAFKSFKKWLKDIYNTIRGSDIDVKISKALRAELDAMFKVDRPKGELPDVPRMDDPHWAMLTAENPRAQELSPEENAALNAKLEAELKARGIEYRRAKGSYGAEENSFLIRADHDEAAELGAMFDQESVLTNEGLLYMETGDVQPGKSIDIHAERPEDFWTQVEGSEQTFAMDIDFDADRVPRGTNVEAPQAVRFEAMSHPSDPRSNSIPSAAHARPRGPLPSEVPHPDGGPIPHEPVSPDLDPPVYDYNESQGVGTRDPMPGDGTGQHEVYNAADAAVQHDRPTAAGQRYGRTQKRPFAQRVRAQWDNLTHTRRIMNASDTRAAMHESGHAVQDVFFNEMGMPEAGSTIYGELDRLGQRVHKTPGNNGYVNEGFAEAMALWAMAPDTLVRLAPETARQIDAWMARDPSRSKKWNRVRTVGTKFLKQTPMARALGNIEFGRPRSNTPLARRARSWFATRWTDKAQPLWKIVERATEIKRQRGELGPKDVLRAEDDPYVIYRVLQKSANAVAEEMLLHGIKSPDGRPITERGLSDALRIVGEFDHEFTAYLVALRARERIAKAQKSGYTGDGRDIVNISANEADAIIKFVEGTSHADAFSAAADIVYKFNDGLLQYMRDWGALDGELHARILEGSEYFIPMERVWDEDTAPAEFLRGLTSGAPVKRFKGSGRRIQDPFAVMQQRTRQMVEIAHRQGVRDALMRLHDTTPGLGEYIEEVPIEDTLKAEGMLSSFKSQLKRQGLDLTKIENQRNIELDRLRDMAEDELIAHAEAAWEQDRASGSHNAKSVRNRSQWEGLKAPTPVHRRGAARGTRRTDLPSAAYEAQPGGPKTKHKVHFGLKMDDGVTVKIEGREAIIDYIMKVRGYPTDDPSNMLIQFFAPKDLPGGKDPIMPMVGNDGQRRWFRVSPDVMRALNGIEVHRHWVERILAIPARVFRAGVTTYNPGFAFITNPLRDSLTYAVQTKGNPVEAAAAYARHAAYAAGNMPPGLTIGATGMTPHQIQRLYMQWGGIAGTHRIEVAKVPTRARQEIAGPSRSLSDVVTKGKRVLRDTRVAGKRVIEVNSPAEALGAVSEIVRTLGSAARDVAGGVTSRLGDLSTATEIVPRGAEMEMSLRRNGWDGTSHVTRNQMLQAMYDAKIVTVDFSSGGYMAEWINQFVPFFNVAFQGPTTQVNALRNRPGTVIGRMAMLAAAGMMNEYMLENEPFYKELSGEEKYRFMYFVLPGDNVIKIPMPQELGFAGVTGKIGYRIAAGEMHGDEWESMMGSFIEGYVPFFDSNIVEASKAGDEAWKHVMLNVNLWPQVFKPWAEMAMNWDSFRGMPIESQGDQYIRKAERFNERTGELALLLGGDPLDLSSNPPFSAKQWDHLIRGYGGSVIHDALNLMTRATTGTRTGGELLDDEVRTFLGRASDHFSRRVLQEGGTVGTRLKERDLIYEELETLNQIQKSRFVEETDFQKRRRLGLMHALDALGLMMNQRRRSKDPNVKAELTEKMRGLINTALQKAGTPQYEVKRKVQRAGVQREKKAQRAQRFKSLSERLQGR
jgi:hypothetical protein